MTVTFWMLVQFLNLFNDNAVLFSDCGKNNRIFRNLESIIYNTSINTIVIVQAEQNKYNFHIFMQDEA